MTEVQNSDHCLIGLSYIGALSISKLPNSSTAGYSFADTEFIPDTESNHKDKEGDDGGLAVGSAGIGPVQSLRTQPRCTS